MIEWVMIGLGGSIVTAILWYGWFMITVFRIVREAKFDIEAYRGKCHGANRFVFNEQTLYDWYPEESESVLREVWRRLVIEQAIIRDPLDNEWCIRK